MSSTTYHHPGNVIGMYAAQEQFRHITKMVCVCHRGLTKLVTKRHQFAVIGTMVRNAGQLPEPFWLGATHGGGSRGAARCAARA